VTVGDDRLNARPRVTLRLYVVFSVLMALSAVASGLFLLILARPFVNELTSQQAERAAILLFTGAAVGGGIAALTGLMVGLRFAGRIRGIIEKAQAISGSLQEAPRGKPLDEIGALDAAVGRLTLSIDRFVRDSDILARLPEGMLLLGPDGGLLSFNATAEALLDLMAPDRFRGEPILSSNGLFPRGEGNETLAGLLEHVQRGERAVEHGEIGVTTATGHRLLLELTVQRREVAGGDPFLVVLFRDAEEKRRIREEIRRADQLAFLGGMAARVAHEIRTPLATVRGLVELLEADLDPHDSRRAYIERILVGMDRQDRLVEDLLTLSHPEPESWQPVSVFALLGELSEVFPNEPRLGMELPSDVAPIIGDPLRLSEVLTNLVRNALEASPSTGTVVVRAEPVGPDIVGLTVRNTGTGISPELRDKIFQPFFTTKPRGTGLGLPIARQIVEAHRGTIRVDSDGTSFTTFIIELPAAATVATRS
jgi:two-component system, NtrC family, sensor histidine kinase AtoS